MLNLYVPLGKLKLAMRVTDNTRDAVLLDLVEDVSRAFDETCDRRFYSELVTRYYNGSGRTYMSIPDDILSITTLKVDEDGDGVYETTLTVSTDYWLSNSDDANVGPFNRIDINPLSTNLSTFPSGRRRVQLVGMIGYSNETEACGTVGEAIDASETSWVMNPGHGLTGGETLVTAAGEQVAVQQVLTDTITVVRAINGTTAGTLAENDVVTRRRFDRLIERAVIMQCARFNRESQSGGAGQSASQQFGGGSSSSLYPAIRDMVMRRHKQAVA